MQTKQPHVYCSKGNARATGNSLSIQTNLNNPGFCPAVFEYCFFSAVRCSAANTDLKLLDRVVSGASFLTGGVFECDIAHRRSVAV